MDSTFTVKTKTYEGPFELLLELIEKRKLFINDISLASVTEEFLAYLRASENRTPGYISSFIVIAATLILIKSKSLLPNLSLTGEEKEEISDLEKRLSLFQIYGDAAALIKERFGERVLYMRDGVIGEAPVFAPDMKITPESMLGAIRSVLSEMPKQEVLPEVEVKKVMSIEDMLISIADRMSTALSMNFKHVTGIDKPANKEEKVLVIVGFLAMLELVRQGILDVLQNDLFGDMDLEKRTDMREALTASDYE